MKKLYFTLTVFVAIFGGFSRTYSNWTLQDSGTLSWLRSVYFISSERGWAAGSNGTFIFTQDGGRHWKSNQKFINYDFVDVFFKDEKRGWLLCEKVNPKNSFNRDTCFLESNDGGATWTSLDLPKVSLRMSRIIPLGEDRLILIGENGTIFELNTVNGEWEIKQLPIAQRIVSGQSIDSLSLILLTRTGIVTKTNDGGKNWLSVLTSENIIATPLTGLLMNRESGFLIGRNGTLWQFNAFNQTWKRESLGITNDLQDICFIDEKTGFIVGDKGLILSSDDGGKTWVTTNSPTTHRLERIVCKSNKAIAVGFGGVIALYQRSN